MSERTLYLLPKKFDTMEVREALEWATNEVLRLDEENIRLKERIRYYESRDEVQTREEDEAAPNE